MTIDIDALVNSPVRDKLDTEFSVPQEKEYIATLGVPRESVKEWFHNVTRDDGTITATVNVPFILQDEEQRIASGMNRLTTRLTIWLDTEIDGRLSTGKGKNVSLGQLREALNQNADTDWNFSKLAGAGPLKVMTKNSTGKDGRTYSNVTRVAKV